MSDNRAQPAPPLTAQELRELAECKYILLCDREKLNELADWLERTEEEKQ